jgi:AAA family ATP:ADP antiporter
MVAVVVIVQVLRRVGNFGLAGPTREILFTVVSREDKYKAKSVIDTIVYRAGDQVGSWSYALLGWAGAGPAGVALVALPISAAWLANALWLGRRQKKLAGTGGSGTTGSGTDTPGTTASDTAASGTAPSGTAAARSAD